MEILEICIPATSGGATLITRRQTACVRWTLSFSPPEGGNVWNGRTASSCGTRGGQTSVAGHENLESQGAARVHAGGNHDRAGDLCRGHDCDLFKLVLHSARFQDRAGRRDMKSVV